MTVITSTTPGPDTKLYSDKSITFATFLGGPLGGGYMISENFKALGKEDQARWALILAVSLSLAIIMLLLLLPGDIVESMPRQLFPIAYTAVAYLVVNKHQQKAISHHREAGFPFYSGWRAAGIGLISGLIFLGAIFGLYYFTPEWESAAYYDSQLEQFERNEQTSLLFYDHLDANTDAMLLQELDEVCIPKWEENIAIMEELIAIESTPGEFKVQNNFLLEYSQLRLAIFQTFKKAISDQSTNYDNKLDELHIRLDRLLE